MGYSQGTTLVIIDNSTANSFVHSEMRVQRSKRRDMKFHWLRDWSAHKQFNILWDKGIRNMMDYFTKHHLPSHHKVKRHKYILKGCNILTRNKHSKFIVSQYGRGTNSPNVCIDHVQTRNKHS